MDRTDQRAFGPTVNNLTPHFWHTRRRLCLLFSGVQPNLSERLSVQAEGSLVETKWPVTIWMQFNSVCGFMCVLIFTKENQLRVGKFQNSNRDGLSRSMLTYKNNFNSYITSAYH